MIEGFTALYIFMLSAFTGYEVISRVPVILHTPLMSGSNFVHGIVLVAAGNAVGGFVVTERMLEMFKSEKEKG
jgi:NAD(P) transhydrogenase subunit alpha